MHYARFSLSSYVLKPPIASSFHPSPFLFIGRDKTARVNASIHLHRASDILPSFLPFFLSINLLRLLSVSLLHSPYCLFLSRPLCVLLIPFFSFFLIFFPLLLYLACSFQLFPLPSIVSLPLRPSFHSLHVTRRAGALYAQTLRVFHVVLLVHIHIVIYI